MSENARNRCSGNFWSVKLTEVRHEFVKNYKAAQKPKCGGWRRSAARMSVPLVPLAHHLKTPQALGCGA
ncbi:hypothetical protein [Caballeronia sp. AZ10_KS36]|uniref:hypothetical protein n=1 Tax=Caballeronia sp. AZ10_KS36 TaxID=2921757 RepID=UPI00202976CC|nr:hypothetical protein [Caballeronia sp. AZ10_KS36]